MAQVNNTETVVGISYVMFGVEIAPNVWLKASTAAGVEELKRIYNGFDQKAREQIVYLARMSDKPTEFIFKQDYDLKKGALKHE